MANTSYPTGVFPSSDSTSPSAKRNAKRSFTADKGLQQPFVDNPKGKLADSPTKNPVNPQDLKK